MTVEISQLKFDERGLIPAIVQDARTREVLTLAYMNAESFARTVETKETWFWSRSRNKLWHKGETSGNTQKVVELLPDCDGDAIVVLVDPAGPACHTGAQSCFGSAATAPLITTDQLLDRLYDLVKEREKTRPVDSYTSYLFNQGLDKILKKLGEESTETIVAAKNNEDERLISEVADLVYHLIVLLVARGISLEQIRAELGRRRTAGGSE
ncbi:MAG TPA: bifunctional phosphoribosyl-AMP cyclohydrolase/phosphoribosyl-ATP diphosphatase HisIE [Pyrinomonadaceae bacterium]